MVDRVPTIDEIDSVEKLAAYLETRPVEEARIIALRCALRVMPLLAPALDSGGVGRETKRYIVEKVFLSCFNSWVNLMYSTSAMIYAEKNKPDLTGLNAGVDAILRTATSAHLAGLVSSPNVASIASTTASHWSGWEMVRDDLKKLQTFASARGFGGAIWGLGLKPNSIEDAEKQFHQQLGNLGKQWSVVWDFYVAFRDGNLPFVSLGSRHEEVIVGITTEEFVFWDRDADEVIREISERLRVDIAEPLATTPPMPPVPEPGPGPQYDIIDGKLGIVASPPAFHEIDVQTRLFERLRRDVERLVDAAVKIHNRHPNLVFSIREYAELMDTPLEALDVTGVWAVGGSLAGFAQSFREQNRNRTLAEPLEPEVDGLLQSVIRQHGAFIMGFEEGRDLVDRADRFALDADTLHSLEESGNPLIAELASNADLVNDGARAVHRSVNDYLQEFGWASARNGYSGFLIIQNAARAIIKFVIHNEFVRNAVLDKFENAFLIAASTFLSNFSASLLAVFANFPEMRTYVQCVLGLMEHDRQLMQ